MGKEFKTTTILSWVVVAEHRHHGTLDIRAGACSGHSMVKVERSEA
jgi:hypothetical protein